MVNYSPKHSRKPSSLTSNRNINMKNLSLNLDDGSSITAGPTSGASKKALSIGISASDQPSDSQSPFLSSSPIVHNNSSTMLLDSKTSSSLKLSPVESSPRVRNNPALHTSKDYKFPHSDLTESFSKLAVSQSETHTLSFRPNVPEELQESSQLDAYPNGPANVLNGSVFLYSEPTIDEINQFDLVINVAKECPDLSAEFNKENLASKKYIYIPWNHTSSISEELPQLTRLMASYDDSDSRSRKRKILVHCQCGVSRSACVVVAYFMMKFKMNVNDAYELLKTGTSASSPEKTNRQVFERGYTIQSCDRICPNMSLIFELMDFNETLNHVH
ncbi:DSPc-domain-containing protein [Yamadazyma tenuis ATCC 10573]|uniref:protein-tyrosine-phosphatase n=2 Tax=Candida tenuis TaxID=2315449 RepID=G3B692_CANTC|nr:DSPc-domain-containing protein [Yamadazyma tenuis ATCC 10573]EGV63417.1 DSPc-domain-containing protein [Yamadazyma tenuis ATCC 10573]